MKNVPIYTANVIMNRISVKGNNEKVIDSVEIKNLVVKGFSLKDISLRNKKRLIKKASEQKKLGNDQHYRVFDISLLKQHGFGINQ